MESSHEKPTDEKVIAIIRNFQRGGYATDDEDEEMLHYLAKWYPGITDIMFNDRLRLSPEQVLEEAKKTNKPILL